MPDGFTDTSVGGNPGLGANPNITNSLNLFCKIIGITDAVVAEAEQNAFFDPKFFESANLYIYIDPNTNYPVIGSYYFSGDGDPPNGGPLVGAGISFPTGMTDGQYYLRIDYYPERLFQKQGPVYKLIEENVLKHWTSYNRILDSFIDNNNDTVLSDGTVVPEKTAVSEVLRQRVDLYADRKKAVTAAEAARSKIADNRAAKKGN
jgi:hypothetical protein